MAPLATGLCSADGEAGVMAQLARMPGQNDILLRDARRHQLVGYGAVAPVVLNPYLIADDVDVNHRTVNALDAVPAHMQVSKWSRSASTTNSVSISPFAGLKRAYSTRT